MIASTIELQSELFPARMQLTGQGPIVLDEGETLKIMISSNAEPIFKAKVPKGKIWKLILSIYGEEEKATEESDNIS